MVAMKVTGNFTRDNYENYRLQKKFNDWFGIH
jgi:hypothetical protein